VVFYTVLYVALYGTVCWRRWRGRSLFARAHACVCGGGGAP
jgi:hypothetical protein